MFKGQLDGYFGILSIFLTVTSHHKSLAHLHQDKMCRMLFRTAAQSSKNLEVEQINDSKEVAERDQILFTVLKIYKARGIHMSSYKHKCIQTRGRREQTV